MHRRIEFNPVVPIIAVVFLCAPNASSGSDREKSGPHGQPQRLSTPRGDVLPAGSEDAPQSKADKPSHATERLRGRVVWMAEALKRRYNIETDADASEWHVALETDKGQLHPIIKDVRGRGFFSDSRLRDVGMELVARRFAQSPMIQVIRVYTLKEEDRYEVDYWCDICAITMFELKQCECCQGPTRIRERKVDPATGKTTDEEPPLDLRLDRRQ